METIRGYATFAGLKNGSNGDIFATGGFVCPADMVGWLSVSGGRRPIIGAVDPFVAETILPHLEMLESDELQPQALLRGFGSWFDSAYGEYGAPAGFYWVIDDRVDNMGGCQANPLEFCQKAFGLRLHPVLEIHSLSGLLSQAGIYPINYQAFARRVLGDDAECRGPKYYHPNVIGQRTIRLARAALNILRPVG